MWEEMQAPIVPFVILGAYDLYPVGSWVNQTGRVTVRYLPPIHPHEATDKEHMMRLVCITLYYTVLYFTIRLIIIQVALDIII